MNNVEEKRSSPSEFRVLVFESQARERAFWPRVLSEFPALVHEEVSTLEEAGHALDQEIFDLAVLDMDIADRDFQRLIVEVRKAAEHQPFLVVLSSAEPDKIIEAVRLGAQDVILRPLDTEAVKRIIGLHRRRITEWRHHLHVDRYVKRKTVTLDLPSDIEILPAVTNRITEEIFRSGGMSGRRIQNLNLAVFECLTNALEHGNLGISYADKTRFIQGGNYVDFIRARAADPAHQGKKIRLVYRIHPHSVLVRIEDEGEGFDVAARMAVMKDRSKAAEDYHGRGLMLVTHLVDRARYNRRGNSVILWMKKFA